MDRRQPETPFISTEHLMKFLKRSLIDLVAYGFLTNAVLAVTGALGLIFFTLLPPSSEMIRAVSSILPRNPDGHAYMSGDEILWLYSVLTLFLLVLSKGFTRLFHLNLSVSEKKKQTLSLLCISGVFLTAWLTLMFAPLLQRIHRIHIQMPNRLGVSIFLLMLYLLGSGSLIVYLKIQDMMG